EVGENALKSCFLAGRVYAISKQDNSLSAGSVRKAMIQDIVHRIVERCTALDLRGLDRISKGGAIVGEVAEHSGFLSECDDHHAVIRFELADKLLCSILDLLELEDRRVAHIEQQGD